MESRNVLAMYIRNVLAIVAPYPAGIQAKL